MPALKAIIAILINIVLSVAVPVLLAIMQPLVFLANLIYISMIVINVLQHVQLLNLVMRAPNNVYNAVLHAMNVELQALIVLLVILVNI